MADFLNESWLAQAFLISDDKLPRASDIANRYWTSASLKFTSARLGGSIAINPRYQYTRYADIRNKGRLADKQEVSLAPNTNIGQGRVYSEVHDDPAQIIYICPGVPQFNSLLGFISTATNPELMSLVRTGRAPSLTFKISSFIGRAISTVFIASRFPVVAISMALGGIYNKLLNKPTSKFYTLKPTPHLYWSAVQSLVESFAINRKIIMPQLKGKLFEERPARPGQVFEVDDDYLKAYSELMPDIFRDGALYDVFALATAAQRTAIKTIYQEYDTYNEASTTDFAGYLYKTMTGKGTHPVVGHTSEGDSTFFGMLDHWLTLGNYKKEEGKEAQAAEGDPRGYQLKEGENGIPKEQNGKFEQFLQGMDAQLRNGAMFLAIRTAHTGAVSESFSNSVVESAIAQQINGASSNAQNIRFTLADGNIVGGAIGAVINGVKEIATDAVTGAAHGLTFGISTAIHALSGIGFMDIPKHWQSSNMNLPRTSYTLELNSPYNNNISLMSDKFIPLAMIMALALPRSTGKASYTSPFICSYYDRGRAQSRLAMVENVSIERGTGNMGFGIDGTPYGMKITLTFVDLSSIMHIPIGGGTIFDFDTVIDEDNLLNDYLAMVSGLDLYSQFYFGPRAALKVAKLVTQKMKYTSPYWLGSMAHHTATAGWLNSATLGLSGTVMEVIEGPLQGSGVITNASTGRGAGS